MLLCWHAECGHHFQLAVVANMITVINIVFYSTALLILPSEPVSLIITAVTMGKVTTELSSCMCKKTIISSRSNSVLVAFVLL